MINDISTLKKAMKGTKRFREKRTPFLDLDGYYTSDFRDTFMRHVQRAINLSQYNTWNYDGTALYTRSTKYVSTVSKFKDIIYGYTYLYILTPKSRDLITLELVYKDMCELKEMDKKTYLKLIKLLHKGE